MSMQSSSYGTPFGGRGGATGRRSARRPPVRPSDEAVAKMLSGLAKVIESPKEPAEVKVQALRSYGRLARGTGHAKEAEEVLFNAAKKANDDRTILGIADALHALGSSKGVELMWRVFGQKPDVEGTNLETRRMAYGMLDKAEAVPPTVESVRLVAEFLTMGGGGGMAMMGGMPGMAFGLGGGPISDGPLKRLSGSAEGIGRLVEATESLPKDSGGEMSSAAGIPGMEGMMGGGGMGMGYTPRDVLLSVLKATTPENEEIATALVEALTSKDAGIRAAAAEALGNVSELPTEAEEIDVSGYIGKGEQVFNTLDRNSDGKASIEELEIIQKLRPSFQKAGFDLGKEMSKEDFLRAFEKATGVGDLPSEADLQQN